MTERKPVVDLSEELAHVGRVFRLHLPLEPVHLVHVLARRKKRITNRSVSFGSFEYKPFMISPRHEETVGIEKFESK